MSQRKAQIKMFETIAVIIVFFFIMIFGLVYYISAQSRAIQKMNDEDKQMRAIEIMKTASYLPELQCGTNNMVATNCLDYYQLINFKSLSDANKSYYTNVLSYGWIKVVAIYPDTWPAKVIYNNSNPKAKNKVHNYIPILIYDSVTGRNNAGYMEMEVQT